MLARAGRFLAEAFLLVFYALGWTTALLVRAVTTVAAAVRLGWKDALALTDGKRQEAEDGTA